ncbi:hypothetical protein KCP75_04990 [Salmonella enterica subsp. enterica]|nr:hypothetical protein KCP75_04990 [Salmonella enterica subsp. enterica]
MTTHAVEPLFQDACACNFAFPLRLHRLASEGGETPALSPIPPAQGKPFRFADAARDFR